MALPRVSKMVTDRQRRCEYVKWFVETYRREVTEALDLFLDPAEDSGLPNTSPSVLAVHLGRLLGRLDRALEELIEAEKVHLDEVGNDAAPRQRRDAAAQAVREVLFDLRRLYRGAYGLEAAEELGFERRIAPDPLALLRQAQRLQKNLAGELPPPRYEGITVPGGPALAALVTPVADLRTALDEVNRQRGKCQGTKLTKDKAMALFDETYLQIVRMLVPSFRLAGKEKLAAQIPLSLRRRARPKSGRGE